MAGTRWDKNEKKQWDTGTVVVNDDLAVISDVAARRLKKLKIVGQPSNMRPVTIFGSSRFSCIISLMKLQIAPLVVFVWILSVMAVAAQTAGQRTVTKVEIDRLEAQAEDKLDKLSYREKTTDLDFSGDEKSPYSMLTEIFEVAGSNRVRSVEEMKDNGGTRRNEAIRIGNKLYRKEGDGAWTVSKTLYLGAPEMVETFPDSPKAKIEYEYLYLGVENLNGVNADVYQVTGKRSYRFTSWTSVDLRVRKLWFDAKGRLLKKEFNSVEGKDQLDPTVKLPKGFEDIIQQPIHSERIITEYEYDIPIKLEAPIK